jgi:hypothetical protein
MVAAYIDVTQECSFIQPQTRFQTPAFNGNLTTFKLENVNDKVGCLKCRRPLVNES